MEELFNSPIIECLFDSRCEEFETCLMKKSKESGTYLDNITKYFEKILKNVGNENSEKVSTLLEEMYLKILDFSSYWDKKYYKFGILDGIQLQRELKIKPEREKSFLFSCETDFTEFIDRNKVKVLYANEEYSKILIKVKNIRQKYENVRKYFEDEEIGEFTKEELKAILEIVRLEDMLQDMEIKEAFKLGMKEVKIL